MEISLDKLIESCGLIYVGEFITNHNTANLISFNWKIKGDITKDKSGRVYFFVEADKNNNKKIIKIGKSNDKNGIKGTLGFYTSTLSGSPSVTRFSVHHLIRQKLDEGKSILVFVKFVESIKTTVFGLTSKIKISIPLDVTYYEKQYLDDFKEIFGSYPEWNFQESGNKLSIYLIEKYVKFMDNKNKKRLT
jgi:hypothetical protein